MALHLKSTGIDWADFSDSSASGASTTSELMDDYEEGTWTPASVVGTLAATNHAVYTKIGREVQVHTSITFGSTSNGSTQRINGYPFTSASGVYGSGVVGYSTYTNTVPQLILFGNDTSMYFYPHNSATPLDAAAFANQRHDFTLHYIT